MRDSVVWFLVLSVVFSSLAVIYVRHQHRIAYSSYQVELSRRDSLNEEWGQLMIEANLWAFPHRIERDASKVLSMRLPMRGEVEFVDENAVSSEVSHAGR